MRWLLLKDLQILRRSPLQAVLLVAYPVLIAVLVGFAHLPRIEQAPGRLPQRSPERLEGHGRWRAAAGDRGRRADLPAGRVHPGRRIAKKHGRRSAPATRWRRWSCPPDLVTEINSLSTPTPGVPEVEVLVNEENPIKAEAVNDRINTLLAEANLLVAKRIAGEGSRFINLLVNGGDFEVVGQSIEILGLKETAKILERVRPAIARRPAAPNRSTG